MAMRPVRLLAFVILVLLAASAAYADTYPSRPIKLIVPATPGSATDVIGRFLTERIAKPLDATFFVENVGGAFGSLATQQLAKSAPDGYTLSIGTNSTHGANVFLYKDVTYDNYKDFSPVARLTRNPTILIVRPGIPAKTLAEFIQYAKANPGKLTYGVGNSAGLANAHLLMMMTGLQATQVDYKSPPAAVVDLLGGRLDFMYLDPALVVVHIKAGTLRPLGVTSTTRIKSLPDIPAIAETLPGYELIGWTAVFAPAGTPPEIVAKLNKAIVDVINGPDGNDYLKKLGMEPFPSTPGELGTYVKEQTAKWGDILTKAGVERQ